MDKELINLYLESRTNYELIAPHVVEYAVTSRTWSITSYIGNYYKDHPTVDRITESGILAYIAKDIARISEHEYKLMKVAITTALSSSTAVDLDDIKQHYTGVATATAIYNQMDDYLKGNTKVGPETLTRTIENYQESIGRIKSSDEAFVAPDLSGVIKSVTAPGLEWRLEELNISCGPLRKGDFVIVAAYVNTGKTTFTASEVSYMAAQLSSDQCVLWINNEEDSEKVFFRLVQATLAKTGSEIVLDPKGNMEAYERIMGGKKKIRILKNSREFRDTRVLEEIIRKENPGLIVFDTMDKITTSSYNKEERQRLGDVYSWARDIAHQYCPVIAISQTNASGETTQWITQSMLRESKNDKPAEGDLILTIGMDSEDINNKERYINVAKNKLFGGPRSVESMRHAKHVVKIDNERVRYVGIKSKTTGT